MMGNKYFIPIRGVIKGNDTSPPAVGSDARGMGRSGPSIHGIRNDFIPAIKTRERPFLPLYAFDFLNFQISRPTNLQTLRLPSFLSFNFVASFDKEPISFSFGFAVDLLFEGLSLTRFLSLQLLLQAFVRCSDLSTLSTFKHPNISKCFCLAFSF